MNSNLELCKWTNIAKSRIGFNWW